MRGRIIHKFLITCVGWPVTSSKINVVCGLLLYSATMMKSIIFSTKSKLADEKGWRLVFRSHGVGGTEGADIENNVRILSWDPSTLATHGTLAHWPLTGHITFRPLPGCETLAVRSFPVTPTQDPALCIWKNGLAV